MWDTFIGIITLIAIQFFKRRADDELADQIKAEAYNRTLDDLENQS
jgi:hypothetical protein